MIEYSFVVPAYNEEEALPLFYEHAMPVFERLDGEFEIIFINDGSSDKTAAVLEKLCAADTRIKGISFSRNFGQQSALLCGLQYARGQAIVAMDADLQDPPEVALQMIEKWREGYEIVHARHRRRKGETAFKRLTAFWYYRAVKKMTGLDMPPDCGDFKLFDRRAAETILSLDEHTRLLRAQAAWIGFKQTVIEFDRPQRAAGETKYTLKKMLRLAEGGVVPNTRKPLYFPLKAGLFLCLGGLAGYIVLAVLNALGIDCGGLTAWLFPSLAVAAGLLSLNTGLQNLYIDEIYKECQRRPHFIIQSTYNLETNAPDGAPGKKDAAQERTAPRREA